MIFQCHLFGEMVYMFNPVSTEHFTVFSELDQVTKLSVLSAFAEWLSGAHAGVMVVQCLWKMHRYRPVRSGEDVLTPGRWVLQSGGDTWANWEEVPLPEGITEGRHSADGREKLGFFGRGTCLLRLEVKAYRVWRWGVLAGGGGKGSTNHHIGPWLGQKGLWVRKLEEGGWYLAWGTLG